MAKASMQIDFGDVRLSGEVRSVGLRMWINPDGQAVVSVVMHDGREQIAAAMDAAEWARFQRLFVAAQKRVAEIVETGQVKAVIGGVRLLGGTSGKDADVELLE